MGVKCGPATHLSGEAEEQATSHQTEARKVAALDVLYRSNVRRLLRLFVRRAGAQDAPDLVQETFVRFARAALERNIEPDCGESYLTQVAVNVLRDRNKSAAHRASIRAVTIDDDLPMTENHLAVLEARDRLKRVEAVMLRLKPMTRDIFFARRFQGLSRSEIAEQTGLSLKAIDKHLAKAGEFLYLHLGGNDGQ